MLKTFTPPEIKKFRDFVKSPYYNKNKNVIKLNETLQKFYPEFSPAKLTEENIYSLVFGKEKFDYFKIKNITLGYTLPANLLKKASIQRLRVYATMTNPLIIAKSPYLKQYDPEMNGSLEYPLTRQIVGGLNVTF